MSDRLFNIEQPQDNTRVVTRELPPISQPTINTTWDIEELNDKQNSTIYNFAESLEKNKKELMKDLGIDSDTYNQLALASLGILGVESQYGKRNSILQNIGLTAKKLFDNNAQSPDYYIKYYLMRLRSPKRSVGLTQIRTQYLTDESKKLYRKYGINPDNPEDLVIDPGKAAVATMIRLVQESAGDVDTAIKRWNPGNKQYIQQVKDNSRHFQINYQSGGKLLQRSKYFTKLQNNFK